MPNKAMILWGKGDAFTLSLMSDGKVSVNVYTILFIALFGIGYGAYYATADMPIPMVADCYDYETTSPASISPVSWALCSAWLTSWFPACPLPWSAWPSALSALTACPPSTTRTPPGMNVVVIVLFCVIPMIAWTATLLAMKNYSLTGEKMKEIQAVQNTPSAFSSGAAIPLPPSANPPPGGRQQVLFPAGSLHRRKLYLFGHFSCRERPDGGFDKKRERHRQSNDFIPFPAFQRFFLL